VVKLRRNFGQTAGLAAGFDHARGEYIIAMDGDLQHDPADIPIFLEKIAAGYDIVSGWRKVRVDNFWMRRIPSRLANWLMAKLSGVDIHDFGTTFKAYRREILEQVPLYGELHRFIPALASWYGASICEVPIRNINRERGISHYGISRTFRVFFDLITIRFLLRYLSRPLHFFGTFGVISMMGGSAIVAWLGAEKFLRHVPVMGAHGPLMMAALGLLLGGLNLLAIGLLGEMQVRHYHEPRHRAPYSVDRVLRAQSEEHSVSE
jgi:glycosyltransferase involved in cell wall biosynthesis